MRRVIGIDIHRTFGEVVMWEDGRLRRLGRVDMTRTALEGLGGKLHPTDEVVIEATGNCMAVSRVLSPFVARVVIANPLQVTAIAHARVKTDKVHAGMLASLLAAGGLGGSLPSGRRNSTAGRTRAVWGHRESNCSRGCRETRDQRHASLSADSGSSAKTEECRCFCRERQDCQWHAVHFGGR
jgi:hypothetical protein